MYFCWLIGFFVKLQVLIKCPLRELQAPSRMTIFEIFLDCLNATLWISILKSVPRRFVKKMKWTKNNENVIFFIICLSQCFLKSIDSISPMEDKEKTWVSIVFADYTFQTNKNSLSLWRSWKLSQLPEFLLNSSKLDSPKGFCQSGYGRTIGSDSSALSCQDIQWMLCIGLFGMGRPTSKCGSRMDQWVNLELQK